MLPDKKIFKDFINQFLILAPGAGGRCYFETSGLSGNLRRRKMIL